MSSLGIYLYGNKYIHEHETCPISDYMERDRREGRGMGWVSCKDAIPIARYVRGNLLLHLYFFSM